MVSSFQKAARLGACLAKDYAEDLFALMVNYRDISASEAASRLNIHIRTAQDFLEMLAELGILEKTEVFERKRPYFRYALKQTEISIEIDLESLFSNRGGDIRLDLPIRERKGAGARFSTARDGEQIASVTTWSGRGRDRRERKISLTAAQGRFLYHLPFPTADYLTVAEIMHRASVEGSNKGEIIDLVGVLDESGVIEVADPTATS
ncbi:MAG: hypothetical protein PVF46_03730 [Lysobacterales bacterium]|jgi:hypothetical protein